MKDNKENKKTKSAALDSRGRKPARKGEPVGRQSGKPKRSAPEKGEEKRIQLSGERVEFKGGAMLSPLPAVMVTVGNGERDNIITIGWCGILSTDPPRAYISVRPQRHSFKLLSENGEFVMNLTTEALARATDFAGIYTGAKMDKFEKLGLTRVKSKQVLPPSILESPVSIECRVFQVIESGTHHIFMADIVAVTADSALFDGGRLCLDRAGLISYAHGEYFATGRKLGKFGFSTDKKKK